jgi:hypothetical protein
MGEQDHELVAAPPEQKVLRPKDRLGFGRDGREHAITLRVALLI